MSGQPTKSDSLIVDEFRPLGYRVHWQHHTARLVSTKPQPEQFRDFATAEEAMDFAQSMRASYPHSVVSTHPVHITRRKRDARNDARQRDLSEILPLPLQRRPRP